VWCVLTVTSFLSSGVSFLHGATCGERTEYVRAASAAASSARGRDEAMSAGASHAGSDQTNARSERVKLPATETRQDGQVTPLTNAAAAAIMALCKCVFIDETLFVTDGTCTNC